MELRFRGSERTRTDDDLSAKTLSHSESLPFYRKTIRSLSWSSWSISCVSLFYSTSVQPLTCRYGTVRPRLCICLYLCRQTGGKAASVCLLTSLFLLLETEAGPAAQFPLLLGKIISPRGAGPGL